MNKLEKRKLEMSNIIISKPTKWDNVLQKLFYITLASANIDYGISNKYTKEGNVIAIKKADVFSLLKVPKEDHNRHTRYRYLFDKMRRLSEFHFGSDEEFEDGFLFYKTRSDRNFWYAYVDPDYMAIVKHIGQTYTKLLLDDVVAFESRFSMSLYQNLMQRRHTGRWGFTTRQLKEIFGLSEADYVNKNSGKFKRTEFETRTIVKAVEEINSHSKTLHIDRWYKKYNGHSVIGYVFEYTVDPVENHVVFGDREIIELQQSDPLDMDGEDYISTKFSEEDKNYAWWMDD